MYRVQIKALPTDSATRAILRRFSPFKTQKVPGLGKTPRACGFQTHCGIPCATEEDMDLQYGPTNDILSSLEAHVLTWSGENQKASEATNSDTEELTRRPEILSCSSECRSLRASQ